MFPAIAWSATDTRPITDAGAIQETHRQAWPGLASASGSHKGDEESVHTGIGRPCRLTTYITHHGNLLRRWGYVPIEGGTRPHHSPRLWPIWCGLILITAGLIIFWAAWMHQWYNQASIWPNTVLPQNLDERVHPYGGPSRAEFESHLLATLHTQTTRPIASQLDSFQQQVALCPDSPESADPSQLRQFGRWWATVTDSELKTARRTVATRVAAEFGFSLDLSVEDQKREVRHSSQWNSSFGNGGRGVVYTGGNGDTLGRLLGSITVLRTLGCTLPIEVWSFPDELESMPPDMRTKLSGLGDVTFRVTASKRTKASKQFQIKGEAIAHTRFTEILYLDSDNVPVRDPTFLFDAPLYKTHGIVLWPDFVRESPANPVFRLLGFDCDPEEFTAETGQILVNREAQGGMNQAALLVAEAMQRDNSFWFKLSMGDKDTFRYAWKFLGLSYTAAPHLFSAAGAATAEYVSQDGKAHTFCGHTMLQYGLSPAEWDSVTTDADYTAPTDHAPPLFAHANLLKDSGFVLLRKLIGPTGWSWIKSVTGKGWNYRKGNTFNKLKMAKPDHVNSVTGSNFLTKHMRQGVLHCRGAGTDFWVDRDVLNAAGEPDEGVLVVNFQEAWGGMLRGFEDMFYTSRPTN